MITLRIGKQIIQDPRDIIFLNEKEILVITWEGGTFIASDSNVREIPVKLATYLLAKRLISNMPSA